MKDKNILSIIDRTQIQPLYDLERQTQKSIVAPMIKLYLEDAPSFVAQIKDAFAKEDWDHLTRAAHTLKSSSAYLGACRLQETARRIESFLLEQVPNQVTRLEIQDLIFELEDLLKFTLEEMRGLAAEGLHEAA